MLRAGEIKMSADADSVSLKMKCSNGKDSRIFDNSITP